MTVNWERVLNEAKGFFYILLGALLMYLGFRLSNSPLTHSAFVFLVVILGVALFLFGTGTSATGEGTSGSVKVAIAGGAGVLAMVLGFGVVHWHSELTDVFKRQRDYGILELTIGQGNSNVPVDLNNYEARASLGEMPLPLWNNNQKIEILVPIPSGTEKRESYVSVKLTPKPGFQTYALNVDDPFTLRWTEDPVQPRVGFNNEIVNVITKPIKQSKTEQLSITTKVPSGAEPPPTQILGEALKPE